MGEDEEMWGENENSFLIINIINWTPSLIVTIHSLIISIINCCKKNERRPRNTMYFLIITIINYYIKWEKDQGTIGRKKMKD